MKFHLDFHWVTREWRRTLTNGSDVKFAFLWCHSTGESYLSQFWEAWDLQSPALVVRQVKMKFIQLVHCHGVNQLCDLLLGHKVPSHVDLHPAVLITGRIINGHLWSPLVSVHDAQERLDAVEGSSYALTDYSNTLCLGVDLQAVGLTWSAFHAVYFDVPNVDVDLTKGAPCKDRAKTKLVCVGEQEKRKSYLQITYKYWVDFDHFFTFLTWGFARQDRSSETFKCNIIGCDHETKKITSHTWSVLIGLVSPNPEFETRKKTWGKNVTLTLACICSIFPNHRHARRARDPIK